MADIHTNCFSAKKKSKIDSTIIAINLCANFNAIHSCFDVIIVSVDKKV